MPHDKGSSATKETVIHGFVLKNVWNHNLSRCRIWESGSHMHVFTDVEIRHILENHAKLDTPARWVAAATFRRKGGDMSIDVCPKWLPFDVQYSDEAIEDITLEFANGPFWETWLASLSPCTVKQIYFRSFWAEDPNGRWNRERPAISFYNSVAQIVSNFREYNIPLFIRDERPAG